MNSMMKITEFLKDHVAVLDGGMGTLLQAAGMVAGEHSESWNLSHPEVVQAIHRDYFEAGSNIVCANTFGVNALKYTDAEMERLITAAIENARVAAKTANAAQEKFIALDLGPTGKLLRPYGDLDFEDAVAAFAKAVEIGARCGVDLVMIETMNDSYETKAALLAVKESCDLPVFVSNAYGEDGKLMTGASPEAMVALLEGMGVDAIGVNCSLGPKALRSVIDRLLAVSSTPIFFKPNAGLPRCVDGKTVYDVLPEEFADEIAKAIEAGVCAVGASPPSRSAKVSRTMWRRLLVA